MPEAVIAAHYDGRNATRHQVRVEPMADGFRIAGDDIAAGPWPWSDLVAIDGTGGQSVYGLKGVQGWRLIFDGPPPLAFAAHLPQPARYGRWIDRIGLTRAVIAFSIVAAGVVFLILQAPAWIAPLIPRSVENQLGDAVAGNLGGDRTCSTPQGRAALDRLALELGAKDAGVRDIEVVHIPQINAMAVPGGRVVVFQGLLDQAKSADEVAGVLAHEIGHVRHRDTMTALVRQMGLSVVMGGIDSRAANAINGLLALSYTREAESAADAYAIDTLRRNSISPEPTAAFFDRLAGDAKAQKTERTFSWMNSHPISADRKAAFLRSKVPGKTYRPAIDEADWKALKGMCGTAKGKTKAGKTPIKPGQAQ
jgi:Zn-dependent protease with chaperone function